MKLALIYNKENEATTGVYIEKVIKNAGIDYVHTSVENASNLEEKMFDLFFRIDHGDYKSDIPSRLRPAVFYVIDTHLKKPYKKIKKQVWHYDIIFCAQKEGAERLRREVRIDTQWIPLACDPEIHKKLDLPQRYDIGFVGRDAKKFARGRQLELLKERYPNSFIGTADFRRISEIYSASKIGFNSSIANDINMRIFEIMSCGCFLLTNQIKDNGLFELFENKKHLVTYRNYRDLLDKVDYYLSHEDERCAIGEAGYRHVLDTGTYFHRVQKMFNYIAFKFGGVYNALRI